MFPLPLLLLLLLATAANAQDAVAADAVGGVVTEPC